MNDRILIHSKWVQVAMLGLALSLSFFFVPDIQEVGKGEKYQTSDEKMGYKKIIERFNPLRTFETFIYPNVLLAVSTHISSLRSDIDFNHRKSPVAS